MRYIIAEDLTIRIAREAAALARKAGQDRYTTGRARGMADAMEMVQKAPGLAVAPTETASWVWDKDGMDWNLGAWVCSKCGARNGNIHAGKEGNPLRWSGTKYCPNCGRKIIQEEREHGQREQEP